MITKVIKENTRLIPIRIICEDNIEESSLFWVFGVILCGIGDNLRKILGSPIALGLGQVV